MRTVAIAYLPALAWGHGAVTFPPPRNAIDSDESPWVEPVKAGKVGFENFCPYPSSSAAKGRNADQGGRNLTYANGQACFWFSNGCGIGCEACDGSTRGPVPAFKCPDKASEGKCVALKNHTDSSTKKKIAPLPVCGTKGMNATICDPKQRTVNTGAECGADDDWYFYSPWRAPGYAPVIDSCGTAGGRIPGQGAGQFGATYATTTHAKDGDIGSNLPNLPPAVTWTPGSVVEVAWTLQANHGGGYSYRICPLGENLTEACFKKNPLDFVGESVFRWGGVEGETHAFNATGVGGKGTNSTSPHGSMWRINPIPRTWRDQKTGAWGFNQQSAWPIASNQGQTGEGFQPFCDDNAEHSCTGEWGPYNMEIVDKVRIPADLAEGDWVLGWRWDCEESNQIWQSCSDVRIAA